MGHVSITSHSSAINGLLSIYTAITDDKLFAQVLLEKLEEEKKIIGIDITESKLKKLPCFVKVKNESEEKETEKKKAKRP